MNLIEYPTPETNAFYRGESVSDDELFAHNLEQRLAMCWEALEFICRHTWDRNGITANACREALEATKPKP